MFNKRALSPLVATMLLIAFAVSLGVVIITVINLLLVPDLCSGVSLTPSGDYNPVCYTSNGNNKFYRINLLYQGSSSNLMNVTINMLGSSSPYSFTTYAKLANNKPVPVTSGQFFSVKNIKYSVKDYGALQKIQVLPVVIEGKAISTCSPELGFTIDANKIPQCKK
ncbi:MAG: hypothetical protein GWP09_02820 [Nitrospiraceae bacterium]|nr:hypothetical protein [Nitrospiraceae bacterium]